MAPRGAALEASGCRIRLVNAVDPAGGALGGGKQPESAFSSLVRKGKLRADGFSVFPLDGDGGIVRAHSAHPALAPASSLLATVAPRGHGPAPQGWLGADTLSLLPQMLQDCPKARREVELHWRASQCAHIVRIMDVYENLYQGRKCLLIVMEW